jgi:Uma2 family endonuclease
VERGAEPDECYVVGSLQGSRVPDVAIEVVWTGGGIDKLDVYRKLGVREVWIWQMGALAFHVLSQRGQVYGVSPRSQLLPAFDPALAARCMAAESQTAAVKMLRAGLRGTGGKKRRVRKG